MKREQKDSMSLGDERNKWRHHKNAQHNELYR